jgi:hypothetical protein
MITAKQAALRLGTATSTLNGWLAEDDARDPDRRLFEFHRWRGNKRIWSEDGFVKLELAIHRESQDGVLSGARLRAKSNRSPADPDADQALADVLGPLFKRTY